MEGDFNYSIVKRKKTESRGSASKAWSLPIKMDEEGRMPMGEGRTGG